jgi:hypothetical protein
MSNMWGLVLGQRAGRAGWPAEISWRHAKDGEFKAVKGWGQGIVEVIACPQAHESEGGLKIIERCFGNSRADRWRSGW